jgi:lipopolysaccharide biosynthesis protein
MRDDLRLIALYLPQFHPIPENNRWWGMGFTEWTNVASARPLFEGHYQPHIPSDLGFYDLRVPETRVAQAALATEYGLGGFCYYHYWFNGRRLLERPFDEILRSGSPHFPFCLCWANESWTRRWDGRSGEILVEQRYSAEDDEAHIEYLLLAFADPRYIKVDGKPLFLVYRSELLPNALKTTDVWRERARQAGFRDLHLVSVESFQSGLDPKVSGFDAAVEFAPDWRLLPRTQALHGAHTRVDAIKQRIRGFTGRHPKAMSVAVYSYERLVSEMLAKPPAAYQRYRCLTPGWDNSPRRKGNPVIFDGATPERYEAWLRALIEVTLRERSGQQRIIFVNAWNEWGEGNHLEPDQRWGRGYLEATARALTGGSS